MILVVRGALDWLDDNAIAYAFGLAGNPTLEARVAAGAGEAALRRVLAGAPARVKSGVSARSPPPPRAGVKSAA